MKRILFFREYLSGIFGRPLQRIPIDLGLSCPNRDRFGRGGCAFCSQDGGRARHLAEGLDLETQVSLGLDYVKRRYNAAPPYAAYFQAFTGTNAGADELKALYEKALSLADFKAAIVATRPDCLPPETVELLAELNERYELWVELGVQTSKDATLDLIGRGHRFDAVEDAVRRLAERGIKTAAHVILGLPGETQEDFQETARRIAALPFSGVKVHNLLVLKGTALERTLAAGQLKTMNEYEYAMALAPFLEALPDEWTVMRLTAEAPPEQVVAPKWWMKKGQFLDMFIKMFDSKFSQGRPFLPALKTEDGSYTLYHPQYRQHFHSVAGAWQESQKKYIEPCRIKERLALGDNLSLLDIGFGLGFNACAAASMAESVRRGKLYVVSLESDANVIGPASKLPEHPAPEMIKAIAESGRWSSDHSCIDIIWGDARDSVSQMKARFDFIFLDGFSSESNPELWTLDFVKHLRRLLKADGFLATYSSSIPFRGALLKSGFRVFESKPFGRRRGGTVGAIDANPWLPPITMKEYLIAKKSTAGAPYRDPALKWPREKIVSYRAGLVAKLRSKGVPKWYKEAPQAAQQQAILKRTRQEQPQEGSSPSA